MEKNYFKSNILNLLSTYNLTSTQLAKETGISKQAVSDWLNKNAIASIVQAAKICEYFSITLDTLFFFDLKSDRIVNKKAELDFFNNAQIAFYTLDHSGEKRYCNQALSDLLGYDRCDLISRPISELIFPEDIPHYRTHIRKLISNLQDNFTFDLRYLHSNGHFFWIRHVAINCPLDKKMYIFSFPTDNLMHGPVHISKNKFFLEEIALKEIDCLKTTSIFMKGLELIKDFHPDIYLYTDENIFKCLIRALFYQTQFIETPEEKRIAKLSSYLKDGIITLRLVMNCTINTKALSIHRLQLVAKMIKAEVEDSMIGNVYVITFTFPES